MRSKRHLAWFNVHSGAWIGEWCGHVPSPHCPPSLIGEARRAVLQTWLQQLQRFITPGGAPYPTTASCWHITAWDECPAGGAVCLDVTMYRWPVGDFRWAVFDGIDRILDYREMRSYLQVTPATAQIDVNATSPRPIRSTSTKMVADITGTSLEPFVGQLFGQLMRQNGRLRFHPAQGFQLPDTVILSITDRNADLGELVQLEPEAIPLA